MRTRSIATILVWLLTSFNVHLFAQLQEPSPPVNLIIDSDMAIDADDVYVVLPEHPWWTDHPQWVNGRPLPDGFVYSSDNNDWWLKPDELSTMLP